MNGIGVTATLPFLLLRDRRVSGEAKLWWMVIASQQARPYDSVNLYADDIAHLSGDVPIAEVHGWEQELQKAGYLRVVSGLNNRSFSYQLLTRRSAPVVPKKPSLDEED